MRKTMNISVSEKMYSFIKERGQTFQYLSVSEYIRHLVREDELRRREEAERPGPNPRRANDYLTDPYDDQDEPETGQGLR
jgi:Arc/MetJ-type ribon-helix-helix transcriptional regulator